MTQDFKVSQKLTPKSKQKVVYVDIDETISKYDGERRYDLATPIPENIAKINKLYDAGWKVIYWTARGSVSGIDYFDFTYKQLESWGCKFHGLICGPEKGHFDMVIDDKAKRIEELPKADGPIETIKEYVPDHKLIVHGMLSQAAEYEDAPWKELEIEDVKIILKVMLFLADEVKANKELSDELFQAMAKVQEFSPRVTLLCAVEFIVNSLDIETRVAKSRKTRRDKLQTIINDLGPWASAAIDDPKVCDELKTIFNTVLEVAD